MGWTLDERRARLVDAAVQLAADRGVENVSLRAAAEAAGMSWDTARTSFEDHGDLLQALSLEVIARVVPVAEIDLAAEGEFEQAAADVAHRFWAALTLHRELQLVSQELAVVALRRTALRPLVARQQQEERDLATQVLVAFAAQHGLTWNRPVEEVGRFVATFVDGLMTQWLVGIEPGVAEDQVTMLVQALAAFVEQPA